jgi:hypothetical protein
MCYVQSRNCAPHNHNIGMQFQKLGGKQVAPMTFRPGLQNRIGLASTRNSMQPLPAHVKVVDLAMTCLLCHTGFFSTLGHSFHQQKTVDAQIFTLRLFREGDETVVVLFIAGTGVVEKFMEKRVPHDDKIVCVNCEAQGLLMDKFI